jgi:LysM repeat protein
MTRLILLACLLLAACTPQEAPAPRAPAQLVPYQTLTPEAVPLGLEAVVTAAQPLPSPTPFIYTVQAGDTMGGIALKFNVSADDLQAANPGISPNSMSIGQVLKIPSDPANPSGEPTPVPAPFAIRQVQCHPAGDGGLWCFVLAYNDTPDFFENISAQVTLVDENGNRIDSQTALLPLNILPPGDSLPLAVLFPPGVPAGARPQVQVLTAVRLLPGATRYLPASLHNVLVSVDWKGYSAQASGEIFLPETSKAAAAIWLAATAYDEQGRVAGFRRWEGGPLQPGGSLPFQITVFSLAGRIDHVDLAVEARP